MMSNFAKEMKGRLEASNLDSNYIYNIILEFLINKMDDIINIINKRIQ